ncbi:MAG TPA: RDD family protein [Vitreimonas sp.]|nr:RDD family protein [Vitreimonas sp.]
MTNTHPLASTRRRMFAAVIDVVIVMFFSLLFCIPFGGSFSMNVGYSLGVWEFSYYNGHIFLLTFLGYFMMSDVMDGRSIGKKLLGLDIVSTIKAKLDRNRLIMRTLVKLGDFFFLGVPLILLTGKSMGDMASKTQVVYTKGTKPSTIKGWKATLKKGLGLLFLAVAVWLWYGIVIHIPQIWSLSRAAQNTWQEMN